MHLSSNWGKSSGFYCLGSYCSMHIWNLFVNLRTIAPTLVGAHYPPSSQCWSVWFRKPAKPDCFLLFLKYSFVHDASPYPKVSELDLMAISSAMQCYCIDCFFISNIKIVLLTFFRFMHLYLLFFFWRMSGCRHAYESSYLNHGFPIHSYCLPHVDLALMELEMTDQERFRADLFAHEPLKLIVFWFFYRLRIDPFRPRQKF